jgi:RNA polymerase sigma-70 factor (ECF subfamily)
MNSDGPRDSEISDSELVGCARSGDEGAFNMLVRRHHDAVLRVALSLMRDVDQARDVAQDTFIKAFRALNEFRGDAAFRTWLLSIAANEARGQLRKRDRRRETVLEDAGPVPSEEVSPADLAVRSQESARARTMMKQLSEKQRMSVALRIDEGLSFKEIGEVIASSEGAARVNYFHGIRRLRELME